MPKSSPARSFGAPVTPRRNPSRSTRSVGSPACPTTSGRLSSLVDQFKENNKDSFALSPLSKTVLSDNTEIEIPRRQSWWRKIDNSRDVIEVLESENPANPINVLEEFDVEVLTQEKKEYTMDLLESSGSESISSIVVPQRRLFTQKENLPQTKFDQVMGNRDSLAKHNKTNIEDKIEAGGTKSLFSQTSKRTKPKFPSALLNISADKTLGNKTKELLADTQGQARHLFGNRAGTKRKNMFADFVVSESEDEIPEIHPKLFAFQRQPEPIRRSSTNSRGFREPSPASSITTDIEIDDWKLLPSSTMVEHQIEALVTPGKKARLSKLSEAKESTVTNSTKLCNKSVVSKNVSKMTTSSPKLKANMTVTEESNDNEIIDDIEEKLAELHRQGIANVVQTETPTQNKSVHLVNKVIEESAESPAFENKRDTQDKEMDTSLKDKEDKDVVEDNYVEAKGADEVEEMEVSIQSDIPCEDNQEQMAELHSSKEDREKTLITDKELKQDSQEKIDDAKEEIQDSDDGNQMDASNYENTQEEIPKQEEELASENEDKEISENKHEESVLEQAEASDQELEISEEITEAEQELEDDEEENQEEIEVDQEIEASYEVIDTHQDEQDTSQEKNDKQRENEELIVKEIEPNDEEINNQHDQERSFRNNDHEDEKEISEEQSVDDIEQASDNESLNEEVEVEYESQKESEEEDDDNNESQPADEEQSQEQEEEEEGVHESAEVEREQQEDEEQQLQETAEPAEAEINKTHDTTGRHRQKPKTNSPEAILHEITNEMDSFAAKGRNTSVRKTKSILKNFTIRPSLASARESTGLSDGTKNSSAEGSGWDSHRTTRKTLRQTFGKDFTPRKSLRALVIEKSAKRQTMINEANAELKLHDANSTELPEESQDDQDVEMYYEDDIEPAESDHEVSKRTRQATLEMYLQKIKKENMEWKLKIKEQVRNSFKSNPVRLDVLNFHVTTKPAIRRANMKSSLQTAPKLKRTKPSVIALEDLPPELVEDMKYKPPKRFRPSNAPWITKRLYKFLESKLEPKYDYKARVRAEKLVETIYNFTRDVRRDRVAPPHAVAELKKEMARLDIVNTHFEFYNFFSDYLPLEIKNKVVPDIVNDIPLPRDGVFAPILV